MKRATAIIIIIIATMTCDTHSQMMVKLGLSQLEAKFQDKNNMDVTVEFYPNQEKLYVMTRQVKRRKVLTLFGEHPEIDDVLNLPPLRTEAMEWITEEKCKVGGDCEPNSDCLGSDASRCDDTHPT